jgi:lysophospholipase L1-like esterase
MITFKTFKTFAMLCGGALLTAVLAVHADTQTTTTAPAQPVAVATNTVVKTNAVKKVEPPRTAETCLTPLVKNPSRHSNFLAQAKSGKCGVLFMGDSITDFWPARGSNSWARFEKYQPLNFGISGDRTENVIWRITDGELDNIDPQAVVLLIGTNNEGRVHDDPEWVAAAIKKILGIIHEKHPKTKVVLMAIFPRDVKNHISRQKNDEINKIIKTYADGKNVIWLDINDKFLDANGEIPASLMPDKLHPSAAGYDIWADALIPVLDQIVK